MKIPFPIRGLHTGVRSTTQPEFTSPSLLNMRPLNPKTGRYTGAQRPPLSKRYTQQIASTTLPIIDIVSVATVELS